LHYIIIIYAVILVSNFQYLNIFSVIPIAEHFMLFAIQIYWTELYSHFFPKKMIQISVENQC